MHFMGCGVCGVRSIVKYVYMWCFMCVWCVLGTFRGGAKVVLALNSTVAYRLLCYLCVCARVWWVCVGAHQVRGVLPLAFRCIHGLFPDYSHAQTLRVQHLATKHQYHTLCRQRQQSVRVCAFVHASTSLRPQFFFDPPTFKKLMVQHKC